MRISPAANRNNYASLLRLSTPATSGGIAAAVADNPGLVVMFVREPIAGAVKTRLVPALGPDGAAALYRAFIDDMCARLASRLPLALAYGADAEPAATGRFVTS